MAINKNILKKNNMSEEEFWEAMNVAYNETEARNPEPKPPPVNNYGVAIAWQTIGSYSHGYNQNGYTGQVKPAHY